MTRPLPHAKDRTEAGFSYMEVLLATLLLAISLVPMLDALTAGLQRGNVHRSIVLQHRHLTSGMEEVLAQPFDDLEAAEAAAGGAPSSYSDPPGADRRLVYLSRYDGDNADADSNPFTGTDADLLWVRVEIESTPYFMETLTVR